MITTDFFEPMNEVDRRLLASIPKKIDAWLNFLGSVALNMKTYKDLSWVIDEQGSSSIFLDGEQPTEIHWTGFAADAQTLTCSESWVTDITNNLDKFIAYEKRFYDIMEDLAEELKPPLSATEVTRR